MIDIKKKFHEEMIYLYIQTKQETDYKPVYLKNMIIDNGGLLTAKILLARPEHPDGLTRLWELKRLDLSMEALVLKEPWNSLFHGYELATAEKRLKELGYFE